MGGRPAPEPACLGARVAMARLAPARRAALRLGAECRQRDARAREVLRTSDVMDGLEARDRALATRLVLGVQRARGLCDAVVNAHLTHSHLEPRVRDALRLSSFELLYLGTPTQVAVSQGVELAAVASRRARGLANAVLRRVAAGNVPAMEAARGRVRAARDAGSVPEVADVALVGALPEWLARELVASLGAGACALALDAMEPPAPTVAANLNLNTEGQAFARLADAGLQPSRLPWPGCIALGAQAGLAASGLVEETCVLPADPAAQMVSWLAAPAAGVGTMLEVGQGRATKTLLIAGANRRLGGKGSTQRGWTRGTCRASFEVRLARCSWMRHVPAPERCAAIRRSRGRWDTSPCAAARPRCRRCSCGCFPPRPRASPQEARSRTPPAPTSGPRTRTSYARFLRVRRAALLRRFPPPRLRVRPCSTQSRCAFYMP